jgi:hypothetical protein
MKGSERIDPKATKNTTTTLSQTQKNKAQPTDRRCIDNRNLNQGGVRPRQHLPSRSLGEQQCTTAAHIALTVYKNHA